MRKKFLLMFFVLSLFTSMGGRYLYAQNGNVEISTEDEFKTFATNVNNGTSYEGRTVTLTNDLTLSDAWTPIGNGSRSSKTYTGNAFKGTFDGNNKTISGLTITSTTAGDDAAIGLFGIVDGGTVKNLNLTDVNINVTSSDLAGAAIGMMLNGAIADNITVSGAIVGHDGVGGIVGRLIIKGTISNCTNNASVTSSYGGIGGIVGKAYYEDGASTSTFAFITGCINNGTVTAPMYIGGIVGLARANVTNCTNNGAIVGGTQTGGIVGQLIAAGTVSGNENKAKVSGKNHLGGIIGDYSQSSAYTYNDVSIANNINRGELAATEQCAAIMGCNNIDGFTAMTASGNISYYYVEGLELFGNPEDMVIDATNMFTPVAQVGDTRYTDLQEAIQAAAPDGTVELLADVTVDKWIMFSETLTISNGNIITININGLTINGNDKTVTIKSIESAGNGNRLFHDATKLNINNLTINYTGDAANQGGIGLTSGTINEVTFNGGGYAIFPGTGEVIIKNCIFKTNSTSIYYEDARDNLVVTGNTFENPDNVNVILLRGNTTFTGNTVISGRTVNVVSGSPVVSGNDFNNVRFKVYNVATATITDNEINNLAFNDESVVFSTFTENTLSEEAQAVLEAANYPVAQIGTTKYATLQAAIDAVQNGETIVLLKDITEELVTIEKDSNLAFTIDGQNNNFTGEFEIGIGENINIKNIKFVASAEISPEYFIDCMDKNSNCVLNITGCTFTDTDYSTTAIGTHQPTKVVIDGCTTAGVASLLQNQGGYNITVKNTTVEGKRGMSLGSVIGATVEKVKITAADDKYGIRLNGENNNNTITIKDCEVQAFIPVVVRKAQVENYNVIFDGTNTMTAKNTDDLWCAIGTSEYETNGTMPTDPTGKVTVTLNDTGLSMDGVYGEYIQVAKIGETYYGSLQAALDAAAASTGNVTVTILENIDLTNVTWSPVTVSAPGYPVVTVEGNNKTITGLTDMLFAGTWAGGSGLIIKDLTIANSAIVNDKDDTKGTVGVGAFIGYPQASATITLDNCHLVESSVEGGHWTGGLIGMAGGYNGPDGPVFMNLTINNCSVTGSTITGKGSVGGIIGHGSCAAWTSVNIDNTTVSGNTITSTGSSTNKAGAVMGTIGAAGQATTANGVTMTGGATVEATVSENTVTSNGTTITTIYGRQGTTTGMLYLDGGSYDNYPIEEGVSYAAPAAGYEIVENADGTYGVNVDPTYGKVAKIGDVYYETLAEAVATAENGATITLLNGEHELPSFSGKELTFKGESKDGVIVNDAPDARTQGWNGSTFHFENLTAKGATTNYHGLANGVVAVTYKDCNINGLRFLYANTVSFEGCAFNANGVEHSFWTYGSSNIAVTNCTFTYTDRAVNCYSENGAEHETDITFSGCSFTYAGTADAPAGAVEINSSSVKSIDVVMNDCIAPAKGAMWFNSQWDSKEGENTIVTVDGKIVWQVIYVAQIGETKYTDLHEAMITAKAGETVMLVDDVDLAGTEWEPVSFKGIFDGNNKTIKNLTINKPGVSNTGFITSLNGTFKNVRFTNPTVTGGECTGVVAGRAGGSAALAENITIDGIIKVETTHSGYARAAAIVGGWAYGNYKNITVDGGDKAQSYIKHTGGGDGRYVAGIVGHADGVDSYVNCTVKNITISGGWLCGAIAGPGPSDGLASGCYVENIDMGADYSGGMFGWYYGNGTIKDATIKGVTFTDGSTNNGVIGGYGQNTDANVENLTFENVQNNNGAPLLDHVASIANNHYFTFAAALNAVENEETITLLGRTGDEKSTEIEFTNDIEFTITGTAPNYALPVVTFQNATVNIKDATILTPELDARQSAIINVINSTVYDAGGNGIVKSYYNGAINIDATSTVYTMQVTTMGYINVTGTLNATWQTNVYGNGLITLNEGATLATGALNLTGKDYSGRDNTDDDRVGKPATIIVNGATLKAGDVKSSNGADYSYNSDSYGINIGTIDGKYALLDVKNNANVSLRMSAGKTINFGAGATVNVNASTLNTICRSAEGEVTLANAGTVYVTGEANLAAAKVTGDGWFYMNGVSLDADTKLLGAKVGFINGTNNIVGSTIKDGWFSVGIGNNDAAATASAFATANNITLGAVTVNVSENATIYTSTDVAYSGWVGSAYSADKDVNKYILNITNSLARFGYMHVSKDGELNATGHSNNKYEYAGNSVDFYAGNFINNGNVTLSGVDAWAQYSKISVDHADAVLNITNGTKYEANCTTGNVNDKTFLYYKAGTVNVDATSSVNIEKVTVLVEGAKLNIASSNVTAKGAVTGNGEIKLTDLSAKFTAQEGLTVINGTENDDIKVVYKDGAYQFIEKVYVAQIGEGENAVKFESLQEAIEEVAEDETITMLKDVTVTEAAYGQNALNHARAISFTLDLNEKTLSANTGNSVFRFNIANSGATSNVTVTVKNGKVVSGADTWCALMASGISADVKAVMNLENLTIENYKGGDFAVKAWDNGVVNAKNVTINASYGGGFYALGGEITLDNCKVEQKGLWTAPYLSMTIGVSNGGKMTVNSGTYSAVPIATTDGNNQGTSHGSWCGGVMSSGGTLIINGGTFSNGNINGTASYPRELFIIGADADYGDNVAANLTINGGTFNSIGALTHCETIWGSANDAANTYMPTMDVIITAGDFTGVAGKTIGGCDPISTGNPVEVEISGGTYAANHAIDDSYLAEGYEVSQIAENVYEVRLSSLEIFYTAAGEVTEQANAAYSLVFTVTDYATKEVSVKIGTSPTKNSYAIMNLPAKVEIGGNDFRITSIPENAFNGCQYFVGDLVIPEFVETIGAHAFNTCHYSVPADKLGTLTFNENLKSIGAQAFKNSYFSDNLSIPASVEIINGNAFDHSVIKGTLTINGDVNSLGGFNTTEFTKLVIAEDVISVSEDAFKGMTKLEEVYLPSSLTQIGRRAFGSNDNITIIRSKAETAPVLLYSTNTEYYRHPFSETVRENAVVLVETNYKNYTEAEKWNEFNNIYGVQEIEKEGYSLIVKVNDEVCSVEIGDKPHYNDNLELDIPTGITYFGQERAITSIADEGFKSCAFKGTLIIPANIKTVGNNAFNSCTRFTSLVVEEGVEKLGKNAFRMDSNLKSITLPASLTYIDEECFSIIYSPALTQPHGELTHIISYGTSPATLCNNAFTTNVENYTSLYVFEEAISLYESAAEWKNFVNIKPIEAKIGETYYHTLAAAVAAAQDEDVITIIADFTMDKPVVIEKDVTLNLNSKAITAENIYPVIRIQNNANVTITGEGSITNNDDYVFVLGASDQSSAGNLIIENGTFTGTTTVASVTKGSLTINGGEFKVKESEYGATYMINCVDANYNDETASVAISGGTFYSFNPQSNAAEGANTNFCAEGFGAKETSTDVWTVFPMQTTQLNAGWNWFSAYVETDLASLQNALGENNENGRITIKDHYSGFITYYPEVGSWYGYGNIGDFEYEKMYMIQIENDVNLQIVGEIINPQEHQITIKNNWNVIGYILDEEMSLSDALSTISPVQGDYIKSKDGYAQYYGGIGWYGTISTMIPGQGYKLQSVVADERTLVYPTTRGNNRSELKANITTDGNYWAPNAAQYPNNMTMTAMVDVEGGDYEVAAFVNGECRGSARPIYVEALDSYILFLTIHGEGVEEMTFKYYDLTTGEEFELNDRMNYSDDAIVGSIKEPYMFNRGTTGIGESSLSEINIYPNPTTIGAEINLQATCDKVEVFNALGVKVAEYQNVDSIDAIETAGIYVIRITNDSNVQNCRLVVK